MCHTQFITIPNSGYIYRSRAHTQRQRERELKNGSLFSSLAFVRLITRGVTLFWVNICFGRDHYFEVVISFVYLFCFWFFTTGISYKLCVRDTDTTKHDLL